MGTGPRLARGGGRGGQNTWGPDWLGPRNLGTMSGNGCYCQDGWGPVMCNHLLVLGPALASLEQDTWTPLQDPLQKRKIMNANSYHVYHYQLVSFHK